MALVKNYRFSLKSIHSIFLEKKVSNQQFSFVKCIIMNFAMRKNWKFSKTFVYWDVLH